MFSRFKFNIRYLHDGADNRGLDSTVEEADCSVQAGNGRELGGGTSLPVTGYFEGLLLGRRKNRVFSAEVQAFEREIGEISGSGLGNCKS